MEKPTAAYVLSLIGGILILLGGIFEAIIGFIGMAMLSSLPVPNIDWLGGLVLVSGFLGLVSGIIVIVGASMINSGERNKVRTGSILVLIFSIISLIVGGGFYLGFILGLVGSILGLIWKPVEEEAPPPPLPPA